MRRLMTAAVASAVLLATSAAPALAITKPDDGDEPGVLPGPLEVLGLFVGIPLLVTLAIYALVYLPSMRSPKTPYTGGSELETTR